MTKPKRINIHQQPARRGPGRPPMLEENKKHAVAVRMKPSDVARLVQLAEACGVTRSDLARVVVLDYLEHPHPIIGAPAGERVTVSDIPFGPAHATAARVPREKLPNATASSTALKARKS